MPFSSFARRRLIYFNYFVCDSNHEKNETQTNTWQFLINDGLMMALLKIELSKKNLGM